jgi:rubredoxin
MSEMKKYKCAFYGHVYDPAVGDEASGIPASTAFEDLPDDWIPHSALRCKERVRSSYVFLRV